MANSTTTKRKNNSWHQGSIRQRGDGRFEGRVTLYGNKKSVYGKTEAECRRKLKALVREYEDNLINPRTATLYEYASDYISKKANTIERTTKNRLQTIAENNIKSSKISKKQLGSISTSDLQNFIDGLATSEEGSYSYGTVKSIYNFLSNVYADGIEKRVLVYNPMIPVKLPRESLFVKKRKETFSLSPSQISEFRTACLTKNKNNGKYKYRYGLILLLILNTGMRLGEMLALEWRDVDFDNKVIRINKSMQYDTKCKNGDVNKIYVKSPKTKNSNRIIPMNNEIAFLLDEIKRFNKNIKTKLVCCDENGNYVIPRSLQRAMNMIIKRTDLPHIWIHLLRHTFGSELIRKGIEISVVSRLMGHSNTMTTYNTYIHVLDEQIIRAMTLPSVG